MDPLLWAGLLFLQASAGSRRGMGFLGLPSGDRMGVRNAEFGWPSSVGWKKSHTLPLCCSSSLGVLNQFEFSLPDCRPFFWLPFELFLGFRVALGARNREKWVSSCPEQTSKWWFTFSYLSTGPPGIYFFSLVLDVLIFTSYVFVIFEGNLVSILVLRPLLELEYKGWDALTYK